MASQDGRPGPGRSPRLENDGRRSVDDAGLTVMANHDLRAAYYVASDLFIPLDQPQKAPDHVTIMTGQEAPIWLPAVNTMLIGISGIAVLAGYGFIRAGHIQRHRGSMLTATFFAALFLVTYVSRVLLFETKIFPEEGILYTLYLANLIPHVILAAILGPLVLITLTIALRSRFSTHKRIARFTLPLWLYTVVSGWIAFLMLYQPWTG